MICAQALFKLVLSSVEIEVPINLRVADKNNKLLNVITCRCQSKIKGQSNSVKISGIYCANKSSKKMQPKVPNRKNLPNVSNKSS